MAFDAIVLAGGAASRMGPAATDKAGLEVGGVPLLDRVLAAVAAAERIVVVGPRRPTAVGGPGSAITFTTEHPPGSGPAAAIVHGLSFVAAPRVVVLAADVPFAATAVPRLLDALAAHPSADAAMLIDQGARRQPLLAAYRTEALRRKAFGARWQAASVRALTEALNVIEIPARGAEALDCDTPEQLAAARTLVGTTELLAPTAPTTPTANPPRVG
jgi:molybdopterin-guanine dinucleotide biosynthesis protein A